MYGRDKLYKVAYECFYLGVMKSISNLSACDTDIRAALCSCEMCFQLPVVVWEWLFL